MSEPITENLVRGVFREIGEELDLPALQQYMPDDFDLFGNISSFTIVELLMATEEKVEEAEGRYIELADEDLFDAAKSPLHSVRAWINYVEARRANG